MKHCVTVVVGEKLRRLSTLLKWFLLHVKCTSIIKKAHLHTDRVLTTDGIGCILTLSKTSYRE